MIREIRADSLDGFRRTIADFRGKFGHRGKSDLLFRGQQAASWAMQTSLERISRERFTIGRYLRHAVAGVHELESFSGHRWDLKPLPELLGELERKDPSRVLLPAYPYLIHLRHFGFPSPLLDWTESPFVALFFAFEDARGPEDVAVYCYAENPSGGKTTWKGEAFIAVQGPFVTTDKRHFSQKAWYTVAVRWDDARKEHYFVPHDEVFAGAAEDPEQDVLFKIVLPSSIRRAVLEELEDYNINHFALFHSEDALVKSIAIRSFDLQDV